MCVCVCVCVFVCNNTCSRPSTPAGQCSPSVQQQTTKPMDTKQRTATADSEQCGWAPQCLVARNTWQRCKNENMKMEVP